MRRIFALVGLCLALALGTTTFALAQDPPPSIAQICAATGIEEVDSLLEGVSGSGLVGELEPLVTLIIPERDTVELDASVQLNDVRQALNCDAVGNPTPTPTPTVTPTETPEPTLPSPTRSPAPDNDNDNDSQFDRVPRGGVDTGGGPA